MELQSYLSNALLASSQTGQVLVLFQSVKTALMELMEQNSAQFLRVSAKNAQLVINVMRQLFKQYLLLLNARLMKYAH